MFDSADKILDFAIQNEQLAADFYTRLADKMNAQSMKDVFLQFAEEEKGHKAKLERVRTGKLLLGAEKKIQDLKIGDNLVEIDLSGDLSYQEALIVAMKAEKAAFKLYTNLAAATDDDGLKQIFLDLAQEEAKHKLRFEIEYDDNILTEN
jgi:rubrerythrin